MNRSRKAAAFSLVEVLCAMLILSVALVGMTAGLATALGSSKESELQTSAALIAAGRIETLRAEGVKILDESDGIASHAPRTGTGLISSFPWHLALNHAELRLRRTAAGLHRRLARARCPSCPSRA